MFELLLLLLLLFIVVVRSPPNVDQMEKMAYSAYLINCRDDLKFSHHETIKGEDDIEDFVQNKLGEKADDDDDGDDDDDWI